MSEFTGLYQLPWIFGYKGVMAEVINVWFEHQGVALLLRKQLCKLLDGCSVNLESESRINIFQNLQFFITFPAHICFIYMSVRVHSIPREPLVFPPKEPLVYTAVPEM